MEYKPDPLNTKNVRLSREILDLEEKLAENIHKIWAQHRIQQGWSYGTERNDQKKSHPNLVPYYQLTEEDKDYDRNTAIETLKVIMMLGYNIEKK